MKETRTYVVEDDANVRAFLMRAFEKLGALQECRVEAFSRGDEALAALRLEPPDLLLTDLGLPAITGETLAEEAGRLEPRPLIVLMSGDDRRLFHARALGQATLSKPFGTVELAEVIGRVVKGEARTRGGE